MLQLIKVKGSCKGESRWIDLSQLREITLFQDPNGSIIRITIFF